MMLTAFISDPAGNVEIADKTEVSKLLYRVKDEAARGRALHNTVTSINMLSKLPDQVFRGDWAVHLFFESDYIFAPSFRVTIERFLEADFGSSCCLLNIDRRVKEGSVDSVRFFEDYADGDSYFDELRKGGSDAWLVNMERYACASDVGDWCIYAEKQNDVAVIALHEHRAVEQFSGALGTLCAASIDDLVRPGAPFRMPFSMLTTSWRLGLPRNYGVRASA